jgi:hypothetical protein
MMISGALARATLGTFRTPNSIEPACLHELQVNAQNPAAQIDMSVVDQFGVNIASMIDQLGHAWTVNMELTHYRYVRQIDKAICCILSL